jgi:hypothetical protein
MPILKKGVTTKTTKPATEPEETDNRRRFFGKTMGSSVEQSAELYYAAMLAESKAKKQKENLRPVLLKATMTEENRVGERSWEIQIKGLTVSATTYDRIKINQEIAEVLLKKRGILDQCLETSISEDKVMEAHYEGLLSEKDLLKIMAKEETKCLKIFPRKK